MSLELWNKLKTPQNEALTEIKAGRLKGKNDINPVWRYQAITEALGPCGFGWKYEKVKQWTEEAHENQRAVFVDINFYYKLNGEWSEPIPATGGDKVIVKETNGLYLNDEAYAMALTDALGKAMKMIGVAADIYFNQIADSKYSREPMHDKNKITDLTRQRIATAAKKLSHTPDAMRDIMQRQFGVDSSQKLTDQQGQELADYLEIGVNN